MTHEDTSSNDYPLSDGELSFSRWRSNNHPRPSPRNDPSAEESTLDFQSQFSHQPASPTSRRAEISASLNSDRPETTHLNDRRGVHLTILPKQLSPEQIRKKFGGPTLASESSAANGEFGDGQAVVVSDDDEFERDFGYKSTDNLGTYPTGKEKVLGKLGSLIDTELHTMRLRDHLSSLEERDSCGSSEMSLQDLVERQEQNVISSRTVLVTFLRTLTFILIWYFFSTSLTIYNKYLLGAKLWDFPAPLLMNTIHFALQAIISSLVLRFCCPLMRPTTQISWKDYFVRVVPTAISTALDIDLTNASLVFISISFETMCKSAAPVFLLFFAFAFKLETPSLKLFGIIVIISSGVLLTGLGSLFESNAEERKFEVLGFILVMLAAVMSGFRWTVTQILLQKKEYGLNNPLAVLSQIAPVMAIVTAAFSIATEPLHKLAKKPFFDTYHDAVKSSLVLLLGGSLAFFMVLAEYLLISKTSAVTLTVAGVVKEVVTIVVAVVFLGDQFTALKALGLAVIMIGVCWFNWFKYQKFRESKHLDQVDFERMPVQYVPLTDKNKDSEENHSF